MLSRIADKTYFLTDFRGLVGFVGVLLAIFCEKIFFMRLETMSNPIGRTTDIRELNNGERE